MKKALKMLGLYTLHKEKYFGLYNVFGLTEDEYVTYKPLSKVWHYMPTIKKLIINHKMYKLG